jgi:fatty-acyl-CoA synthase
MMDMQESTVSAWLNQVAREHPEREALVHQQRGIRFTYRTFMDQVGRLARGLMSLGIQKGEPVALWGSNCPEWGLAKTGAVLTALDPGYGLEELRYALSQSGVRAVLAQEGPNGSYLEMLRSLPPDFWENNPRRKKALPSLRSIITLSETDIPLPGLRELSVWGERVSPSQLRGREDSLVFRSGLFSLSTYSYSLGTAQIMRKG